MQNEDSIDRSEIIEKVLQTNKNDNNERSSTITYINGSLLRRQHQKLQPLQAPRIDFLLPPKLVSIEKQISGPSAEIVFSVKPLQDSQLKPIEEFYSRLVEKVDQRYTNILEMKKAELENQELLLTSLQALFDQESKRVTTENGRQTIDKQEVEEKLADILPLLDVTYKKSEESLKLLKEFDDLINKAAYFCVDNNENVISTRMQSGLFEYQTISPEKMLAMTDEEEMKVKDSCLHVISKHLNIMEICFQQLTLSLKLIKERREEVDGAKAMCERVKQKITLFRQKEERKIIDEESETTGDIILPETISFDNVSCFYCPEWPTKAQNWLSRCRKWPSESNVQAIASKGSYLVAKQSDHDVKSRLEWRLSFSSAEISIAKLRSPRMQYCYFVFKALFYRYLKAGFSEEIPSLTSYIAKTCMLNVSEEQEVSWWDENTITTCVIHLLRYLDKSLAEGCLVHHFIQSLNLLVDISQHTIRKSREVVSNILENPSDHITIDEVSLQIFNSVSQEVSQLNALAECTGTKTSKESYQEVSDLYTRLLSLHAKMTQCELLSDIYMLSAKIGMVEKVIAAQESMMGLASVLNDASKSFTQDFLKVNKSNLIENKRLLEEATTKADRVLGEIAKMFSLDQCMVCDICKKRIKCKQHRYTCAQGCDFDVCLSCVSQCAKSTNTNNKKGTEEGQSTGNGCDNNASEKNIANTSLDTPNDNKDNVEDEILKLYLTSRKAIYIGHISETDNNTVNRPNNRFHEHTLRTTNQCSLFCYTNLNLMKFGMSPEQASQLSSNQMLEYTKETQTLFTALGTKNKKLAHFIGGNESVVTGLLQELYQSLGLEYNSVYGKTRLPKELPYAAQKTFVNLIF